MANVLISCKGKKNAYIKGYNRSSLLQKLQPGALQSFPLSRAHTAWLWHASESLGVWFLYEKMYISKVYIYLFLSKMMHSFTADKCPRFSLSFAPRRKIISLGVVWSLWLISALGPSVICMKVLITKLHLSEEKSPWGLTGLLLPRGVFSHTKS